MKANSTGLTYLQAGVDINAGESLVDAIKPLAKRTLNAHVMNGIGGFGALFEVPKRFEEPVLVSGTDGVGTKLKLAFDLHQHNTIGQDLVAMSVNDILVQGAEPLFFLDYFACSRLNVATATQVISGIAQGCELAGCALIGGETAEMPGMYNAEEYDLAGFAVGVVEKKNIINGATIAAGDQVLGLASSGAHANGYSLIRKVLEVCQPDMKANLPELNSATLTDVLMAPTRIYVKSILSIIKKINIKGMAHITGGGLLDNLPRVLPAHLKAVCDTNNWAQPALFNWLQKNGQIADQEMYRVFNCGIGMAIVVAKDEIELAHELLTAAGETVWTIGEISARETAEAQTIVV